VDLLAIVERFDERFDPKTYSIYSYTRLHQLWREGNPFAWHLSQEAGLIFASDQIDFIANLGVPAQYLGCIRDCHKFFNLFETSCDSLCSGDSTATFDLSTIFLSIRNIATCHSLGVLGKPSFARDSALRLGLTSLPIDPDVYSILERSRVLCTRGSGENIQSGEVDVLKRELPRIRTWMKSLIQEAVSHG
jgi:hypothetical protein